MIRRLAGGTIPQRVFSALSTVGRSERSDTTHILAPVWTEGAEQLHLGEHQDQAASPDDEDHWFLRRQECPAPLGPREFEIVDLFAGCGGLTFGVIEGARRCGISAKLALAVDNEPSALDVIGRTLGEPRDRFRWADLEVTLKKVGARVTHAERSLFGSVRPMVLLAGPPCQGHSALNNHTRHDDPRNDLYVYVARAAQLLEPAVVVIENVRGVRSDRRSSVERCARLLESLGYRVSARRLNLAELGFHSGVSATSWSRPQRGLLSGCCPSTRHGRSSWAIEDLLEAEGTNPFNTASRATRENLDRIEWLFENDAYDLPNRLRPTCHHGDHSYGSMYGRLRWTDQRRP